jgi:hypothetical protein
MKHGAALGETAMPTTKQRISINLPDAEYEELSAIAKRNNLSMAWIGHKAVLEFLVRYRDKQLPLMFSDHAPRTGLLETGSR